MSEKLMLLDTAGLYFRAFFALPKTMRAPDGTSVNALRGTLDMLAALNERFEPDRIVAAWDENWRPDWRVQRAPNYKAHRLRPETDNEEEKPELLELQEPLVREMLELFGIPVVGHAQAEADDVIGTLCGKWEGPVVVVTGDRDLLQLVNDSQQIQVAYIGAGMGRLRVNDEAAVLDDHDVRAADYVLAAALRGDPADGLPGVKGVGAKRAAELVNRYDSLDEILAAASDAESGLTPALRAALTEGADAVRAAVDVSNVQRDLDIGIPSPLQPDVTTFDEFAERWGLGGSARRAKAAFSLG